MTENKASDTDPIYINRADLEDIRLGHSNEEFYKQANDIDEQTFEVLESVKRPSKGFWKHNRFGRFLSGRTQAGRVFRRVGLGALTVGAGLVGIDADLLQLGVEQAVSGQNGDMVRELELIRDIVLAIGAIITSLTKGADMTENYGEKADEMERKENKAPALRTITNSVNSNKNR